ncbi:MAG: hypothetical protein AAGC47_14035 [Bacteroidota bacterium]
MNRQLINKKVKSTFVASIIRRMFKYDLKPFYFFILTSIIILSSCETEVELLAPYEETPVIYGILDYTADTQFVRINKTFLGEGEPSQYSAIKDSVEYEEGDVSATIVKFNEEGNEVASFPLQIIDRPSRDPGIFYDEDVRFYFTDAELFTQDDLDQVLFNPSDFSFELRVDIQGEQYAATTVFPGISESTITFPNDINGEPARLAFAFGTQTLMFTSVNLRFLSDNSTETYSGLLRMNFDYVTVEDELVENQFIDFNLGEFQNDESGAPFNAVVQGENYYTFLKSELDMIPGLKEVQIFNLETIIIGAPPELSTYIDVAQPVSEFSPTFSTFTNFDNGAIGLFSSRGSETRIALLDNKSVQMLNENSITNEYDFCTQGWTGSSFLCVP